MRAGALVDYTIRVLGLRMRWTTMITTYDPPMRFVDEQLKGPYSFWHHTHAFVEEDDGTRMVDTVRYALPFGVVGTMAHALVVRRQIRRIFEYREKVIAGRFEANDAGGAHNADQTSGRSLTVEAQP